MITSKKTVRGAHLINVQSYARHQRSIAKLPTVQVPVSMPSEAQAGFSPLRFAPEIIAMIIWSSLSAYQLI